MKYNTKVDKNNFYDEYHQKNDNYFEIISKNNFTYYYIQKALSFVFSKKKPTKVLDIGCGVGTIGFYLTSLGSDVVGYDVSPRAIAIANNYKKISKIDSITFFNKDVQKSKYSSDFDLVIEVPAYLSIFLIDFLHILKILNSANFFLLLN